MFNLLFLFSRGDEYARPLVDLTKPEPCTKVRFPLILPMWNRFMHWWVIITWLDQLCSSTSNLMPSLFSSYLGNRIETEWTVCSSWTSPERRPGDWFDKFSGLETSRWSTIQCGDFKWSRVKSYRNYSLSECYRVRTNWTHRTVLYPSSRCLL